MALGINTKEDFNREVKLLVGVQAAIEKLKEDEKNITNKLIASEDLNEDGLVEINVVTSYVVSCDEIKSLKTKIEEIRQEKIKKDEDVTTRISKKIIIK